MLYNLFSSKHDTLGEEYQVKTRSLSSAARIAGLVGLLLFFLLAAGGLIRANGVIQTNVWMDLLSSNSTFLGQPVPAGALIEVFDPQGVKCAEATATAAGQYGIMPCYGNERPPSPTPDLVDEGPEPGDPLSFKINGLPATPELKSLDGTPVVPPLTTVTWQDRVRAEVDLRVVGTPAPAPVARPVGGYGESLSSLELLGPWILLILGGAMGVMLGTVLRRRVT